MSGGGWTPGSWLIHGAMLGYRGDIFSPTEKAVKDCHHIARCFAPKPEKPAICELQAIGVQRDAIAIIEANARLIAAAPDLLAALERLSTAVTTRALRGRDHVPAMREEQDAARDARAAIAKSRGAA